MARPGLRNHPKFRRLVHLLNMPAVYAQAHLQAMWEVGYERGNPKLGDETDVELAAEWTGEPGSLFKHMLQLRWIDEVDGEYHIHDLMDHAPDYVRLRREKELERLKDKDCAHCGGKFHSTERHARFCSDRCRVAFNRNNPKSVTQDTKGCVTVTDRQTECYADPTPTPTPTPIKRPPTGVRPSGRATTGQTEIPTPGEPAGSARDEKVSPTTAPCPKPATRTSGGTVLGAEKPLRENRPDKTERPEHGEVRDYFRVRWKEVRGGGEVEYPWKFGRDDKSLLWVFEQVGREAAGVAEAKRVIDAFLADREEWICEKGHDFGTMVSQFARFRAKPVAAVPRNGRHGPPPPPGGGSITRKQVYGKVD